MSAIYRKKNRGRSGQPSQSGVALAILVWFLAAMSILVAGIVMQARVDIKLAQLHATRAKVEAAADGAIQLALADLMLREREGEFSGRAVNHGAHRLGDIDVSVSFTPLSGLVDLNQAPEGLLLALFSTIPDVDEIAGHELAANVVKWRTGELFAEPMGARRTTGAADGQTGMESPAQTSMGPDTNKAPHGRFESIEDLLLVEGVDRRIFEAVQDSIYVDQSGQVGVDWMSAPVSVLRALGEMDNETAMELVEWRMTEGVENMTAPGGIDLSFQGAADLTTYRADALVVLDGTVYRRRRWVDRARSGADGLPWRYFRTEAVRALGRKEGDKLVTEEGAHAGN